MRDIDRQAAARALRSTGFNFLRRGADLMLSMSGAKWRLVDETPETFTFRPVGPSGAPLPSLPGEAMVLRLADVEGIVVRMNHKKGLLVVSVNLLRRSIAVQLDCTALEAA